jgi:hypothetical protein
MARLLRRVRHGEPIVVVSGLPRSGTSMTMKMLEAGGLACVADGVRTADEDNPKGYFEDERVKDLDKDIDTSWLKDARGKVIKIVSPLLQGLPATNHYKILFMRRNLREVLASQKKMLDRRGETSDTADEKMIASYEEHLDKIQFLIRYRPHLEALYIDYRQVIEQPREQAERINDFLGGGLDVDSMVEMVDSSLYRNRAPGESAT